MRRFILFAAMLSVIGCFHDKTLAPVQTADGEWKGTQNGYALTLSLLQSGTDVSGVSIIGSNGGFVQGTAAGTFKYPALHVTITVPGFYTLDYDGTMSANEAKIFGKLNGSGLTNVEVDIKKQ